MMKSIASIIVTSLLAKASEVEVTIPDSCFAKSKTPYGLSDLSDGATFSHRERILQGDFSLNMRLMTLKGCHETFSERFAGI